MLCLGYFVTVTENWLVFPMFQCPQFTSMEVLSQCFCTGLSWSGDGDVIRGPGISEVTVPPTGTVYDSTQIYWEKES